MKLVIGASGFLGSHVTRELVERGHRVRVMLRPSSPTRGIDDLSVERVYGDLFDTGRPRAVRLHQLSGHDRARNRRPGHGGDGA